MANSASLDTTFLVPCKHCRELLQEGAPFCLACGRDQFSAVSANAGAEADAADAAGVDDASAIAAAQDLSGSLWRQEALRASPPEHWTAAAAESRAQAPNRWLIGIAATVALGLVLALVHDQFFSGSTAATRDAGAPQERNAKTEPPKRILRIAIPDAAVQQAPNDAQTAPAIEAPGQQATGKLEPTPAAIPAPEPTAPADAPRAPVVDAVEALSIKRPDTPRAAPASSAKTASAKATPVVPSTSAASPPAVSEPRPPPPPPAACDEALSALALCQRN